MVRTHLDDINLLFIDYFITVFLRTPVCTGVMVLRVYLFTYLFEVQML